MKVTLLIAVCTLVLMLQQMQTPMAKPTFDQFHECDVSESFLFFCIQHRTDQQTLMQRNYFHSVPGYTQTS